MPQKPSVLLAAVRPSYTAVRRSLKTLWEALTRLALPGGERPDGCFGFAPRSMNGPAIAALDSAPRQGWKVPGVLAADKTAKRDCCG
jgi:hypothetical protein